MTLLTSSMLFIITNDKHHQTTNNSNDNISLTFKYRAEARKTPDGKHYIVNGEKKWITNGVFADYFTVAVRTGGPGMGGVSYY